MTAPCTWCRLVPRETVLFRVHKGYADIMETLEAVHKTPAEKRVARGVRMDESLWAFVDDLAEMVSDGNASRLIERWAREKRDAVKGAA